jgi:cobalt-zinc-cadmium efflux system membrane fusion protein
VGVVDTTRTIALRIRVDGACPELVPGRFVEVSFGEAVIAAEPDAGVELYVPTAAIVEIRGVPSVFVALAGAAEGKFVRRSVRTGTTSGDDTVVAAGLASGERVVTRGALLLKGEILRGDLQ